MRSIVALWLLASLCSVAACAATARAPLRWAPARSETSAAGPDGVAVTSGTRAGSSAGVAVPPGAVPSAALGTAAGAVDEWDPIMADPDEGPDRPPATGNAYKQLLARRPDGTTEWDADLNMTLPAPWDIVNMTEVLRDNLAPVARWWRQRGRQPRVRDLYLSALNAPLYKQSDTHRVVVIRNNVITFPLMPPGLRQFECDWMNCNPQLSAWLKAMHVAVHTYKLQLPDVVLSLSVQDGGGRCGRDRINVDTGECAAPSLSVSQLDVATDLLAPMMLQPDSNVTWRHAPWRDKSGKAFFRGVPSCGELRWEPGVCGRTVVARLAQLRPDLLDAGVVMPVHEAPQDWAKDPALQDGRGRVPVLPRAPRSALPLHKYLLSLDGHTAAYRFAMLLGTNSLVLKQVSRQVEWFYGSVRPWTHYAPILANRTDVVSALEWAEAHPPEVGAMIAAANRFALTYTTYYARVVYWVYALHVYKSLFADQAEFFASRGAVVRDLVAAYQRVHWRSGGAGGRGGDGGGRGAGGDARGDAGAGSTGSVAPAGQSAEESGGGSTRHGPGGGHARLSRRRHARADAWPGGLAGGNEQR